MKVVQAFWDGGGNTAPQLGIARALIRRGHEVTFLGNACQREKVEAAGAAFVPYRHAPENDASSPETDQLRDWEAKTPLGAFARTRDRMMYGPAALFARDFLEATEGSPPDVVAWDMMLMGVGVGVERAGVPSAAIIHTVYPAPTPGLPPFGLGFAPPRGAPGRARDAAIRRAFTALFRPGLKSLNAARGGLDLAPISGPFDQILGADLNLILTSPEFDFAGDVELPDNARFVGPVADRRPAGDWESPWPSDDERPLVVAGFSTTFMDQRALAAAVVEALGGLEVRGLVTTGPAIDPAGLPRPANVEIRKFVPHAAVLPEAAAMITHAGMGTVHAGLAAGVPLVCVPDGRDQPDVAARVVERGAGVRLGRRPSAAKLRRAVTEVLGDASYRAAAERLAAAFAREDGAERAADELEALAGRA